MARDLNTQSIKAILFDRDGTLLDLQGTWAGALYHMIDEMAQGRAQVMQAIADISGYCLKTRKFSQDSQLLTRAPSNYMGQWAELCGRPYDDEFWAYFEALSLKYCDISPTLLPGVQQALDALRQAAIPMGIATNGTESSARRQMQHLGLEDYFCYIVGSDSGHGQKPGPGQVLGFAEQLEVEPDDVLMVGDSLHDIHAGQAAGSMTLGLPTGAGSMEELLAHSDQVLPSLSDLPVLLELALPAIAPSPRPLPF